MRRPRALAPALALLVAAAGATPAGAHEEGAIRLSPERAAVGSTVEILGEEFDGDLRLRLRLVGTLETLDLAEVETDEEGTFEISVALPAGAGSGRYTVVAVAPDGDEVARADLEIVEAGEHGEPAARAGAPRRAEATDAPLPLPVRPGPGEWLAIAAFVLACGLGGLALLRGADR